VQLFENKQKNTNLATPSKNACYPQPYVLLNEANNLKICSSSGGTPGKEDKLKLSLPQKLMVFGVSSTPALPLLLMYFFAGFFFESHLVYVFCFPHFTDNSIAIVFQLFLGTSQRSCVSQSVPLCL